MTERLKVAVIGAFSVGVNLLIGEVPLAILMGLATIFVLYEMGR